MVWAVFRAPYASDPEQSRGRLHPEPEHATRSPFQRDRDRVIHSSAFRRLQYKTQVFVYHEGDHYRTRLTHSLEVAQIARTIARTLGLNEDLAEALALAHDLGHTPFGHAGEEALNAEMAPYGGFSHNDQTLRILTRLEHGYAEFDGLNLTWEALEGTVKHNGPLLGAAIEKPVPPSIAEYDRQHPLELDTFPGPEAQVAALSDDIAYNNHDIDDGLRAGLFAVADLAEVPLVGPVFNEVARHYPGLEDSRLVHESIRRLIDRMVRDLVEETRRRLAESGVESADAVRALGRPVAAFSEGMRNHDRALKQFLYERMYRHDRVNRMTSNARRVVSELFRLYLAEPGKLPPEWRAHAGGGEAERARLVADYLAGMTDRFALDEHRRLVNT
ncbi:MAG: deoxyguanosinetriphosphate triphosphohydrolase [Alphaproteobacteria bacterium]|nr:deoxyguanosinetriphosphate triphosphohydrolase [Alphaproteobacteria bacterium]MBV9587483.1 deoxyguanosinetriphosphate triphosphohydrolase [Alphaproteobacteria bacterium]MBV9966641.1 deoxyguanosinetriphosphate triphosphohydrolase [Alphaproteobacteria bacterium]